MKELFCRKCGSVMIIWSTNLNGMEQKCCECRECGYISTDWEEEEEEEK